MLSRSGVCKIVQGLTWLGTDLAVEDKDVRAGGDSIVGLAVRDSIALPQSQKFAPLVLSYSSFHTH